MKKSLKLIVSIIVFTVIFTWISASASPLSDKHTPGAHIDAHLKEAWTPIQIDFLTLHIPTTEHYPNIYGLRVGLPITYKDSAHVYGIDISALFSANNYTKGLQFSVIGTQARDLDGLQVSIVNFVKEKLYGLQFGGVNHVKEKLYGLQVGGVNYVKKAIGLQFGLFNYTEDSQGILQVGVLNINKNGWLPYSLILNFDF